MPLKESLTNDLKDAMRPARWPCAATPSACCSPRSATKRRRSAPTPSPDDAVLQVLSRQAQQRRDSIEAYQKGNRPDLVAKEEAELAIVIQYLPQPLSEDEIAAIVQSAIADVSATGPQDMGKVMGKVMPASARPRGRQAGQRAG